MTTIVYCHKTKQIAVDSRVTAGMLIKSDSAAKFIKNKRGEIWFISGQRSEGENYSKLKHGDVVNDDFNIDAIVIKDGEVYSAIESNGVLSFCKVEWNEATGSGNEFALAALDFGKTAKEAVEYAATKDCYTGGKVHVFNLDGGEVL